MTPHKDLVNRYIDGFRRGDREQILSCLTDDVLWEIHGLETVRGKAGFAGAIRHESTTGRPTLTVDRLVEEGDTIVAIGDGKAELAAGGRLEFVFCTVFTFRAGAIGRVESYQVNLVP